MKKNRTILILGFLTLVTPFLGIPNSVQDWLIAVYGLILIFIILFEYFSSRDNSVVKEDEEEINFQAESSFEENGLQEEVKDDIEESEEVEDTGEDLTEEESDEETEDDRVR